MRLAGRAAIAHSIIGGSPCAMDEGGHTLASSIIGRCFLASSIIGRCLLALPCLALRTLAVSFGYTIVTLPFYSLMVRTEIGIYPLPVAMCTSDYFAKPSLYIAIHWSCHGLRHIVVHPCFQTLLLIVSSRGLPCLIHHYLQRCAWMT